MSSACHPSMDGQNSIVNKCLETYMHCFATYKQIKWFHWSHLVEQWYNFSYHTSCVDDTFQGPI